MKITRGQLRQIIKEEKARLRRERLDEGFWETVTDFIDPSGWVFSGAGAGIDEDLLKRTASGDAWILFKALGGLGTDENAVEGVISRRRSTPGGLQKLHDEFDQLRVNLVKMRKSGKANILQGLLGAFVSPFSSSPAGYARKKFGSKLQNKLGGKFTDSVVGGAAQVGINKIMQGMQNRDLVAWLRSDGMDSAANEVQAAITTGGNVPMGEGRRRVIVSLSQIRETIREHLQEAGETNVSSKEAEEMGYNDGKADKEHMYLKSNPSYKIGHRKGQAEKGSEESRRNAADKSSSPQQANKSSSPQP